MLAGSKGDKYHAHETKRVSRTVLMALGGAVLVATIVVLVFLLVGRSQGTHTQTVPPARPITLAEARRWSNCSAWSGAMDSVRAVAEGQSYLHNFEFDRLHPCCLRSNTAPLTPRSLEAAATHHTSLTADDIVFVVITSSKTPLKAKSVLDTWGQGLDNLVMISDSDDPELPPGTITPSAAKAKRERVRNGGSSSSSSEQHGSAGSGRRHQKHAASPAAAAASASVHGSGAHEPHGAASGGGSGSGTDRSDRNAEDREPESSLPLTPRTPAVPVIDHPTNDNSNGHATGAGGSGSGSGVGASFRAAMDEAHTPIWGLKYLSAAPEFATAMRSKKWFLVADDDTWINIPALLEFAGRYDPQCAVVFGYVWSKIWSDQAQVDYHSGGAGMLMSSEAFWSIAPQLYTPNCPFHHYNDITFGRCAWHNRVQLVHSRAFYYDPPERSKDRHETVWLPPVAEAITYHYVNSADMQLMTRYVNQRWQYVPGAGGGGTDSTGNSGNSAESAGASGDGGSSGSNGSSKRARPIFFSVTPKELKHTDWAALARKHS